MSIEWCCKFCTKRLDARSCHAQHMFMAKKSSPPLVNSSMSPESHADAPFIPEAIADAGVATPPATGGAGEPAIHPTPGEKDLLTLILFQEPGEMIDRELVQTVRDMLDEKATSRSADTVIDVWIDSGGGDAHAAFKLYRELRSRCSELRAVVPDFAKSAATLLAIGCDHIYASPSADFGPLDVQIEHPDREGKVVSSLAGANAAEHLANLGVSLMLAMGKTIVDVTHLPRGEVIKQVLMYSSDILKPVLSKLDPQLIHEAAEQLKVTRKYAEALLFSRNDMLTAEKRNDIATKLVTQYPTHGYVIDLKELKRLGLKCSPLSAHPHFDRIKEAHKVVSRDGRGITDLLRIS